MQNSFNPKGKRKHIKLDIYSKHPEFLRMAEEVYSMLDMSGHPKKNKQHLNMLLCNLYILAETTSEHNLSYHRNNVRYHSCQSRYNPASTSKDITVRLADALYNTDLIHHKLGWYNPIKQKGMLSRMKYTQLLKGIFSRYELNLNMVEVHRHKETVILRGDKREEGYRRDIEYEDTQETYRMREFLRRYNGLLAMTDVSYSGDDNDIVSMGGRPNYADKFVRRVFNNSSFEQGGRFYGGWWQGCKNRGKQRDGILLDGVATVELDYSALHIYICYSLKGEPVKGYPYDIKAYNFKYINLILAEPIIINLAKLALLAAINCESQEQAYKAIRQEFYSLFFKLYGNEEKLNREIIFPNGKITDDVIRELLQAIIYYNPAIEEYICSGLGSVFQYYDSVIAEFILDKFIFLNKPVLCFHDSFRVRVEDELLLRDTMKEAYRASFPDTTIPIIK